MARYKQAERDEAIGFARQYFLTAAIEEIARVGYASANINRISQAAGFGKGTIYNHFASKEALMLEIIATLGAHHLACIREAVLKESDPKARLERFFMAGFAYVEENPTEAQLLVTTLYSPETRFREALSIAYQPMFRLLDQDILAPGIAAGVFRKVTPLEYTSLLMTLYLGSCSLVDEKGKPRFDPHLVAEFALHSLRD